ncbi:MAG: aminopeptidase [Pseudobutyrivibrio sp.]|nr:aminopeptidase [Pseudobutyrivibrio sp.]
MSSTFYKETDDILERYELATERIVTISEDAVLPAELQRYFAEVAAFISNGLLPIMTQAVKGTLSERSLEQCVADNDRVFRIYDTEVYKNSFLCPAYAVEHLGQELGGPLSSLYYKLTDMIRAAFAGRLDIFTIYCELFLQIYGECQMEEEDKYRRESVVNALYSFEHDYCNVFMSENLISMVDPDYDFYTDIIMNADLSDDRYLYSYGMYIGPNERGIAAHLRSLPHEDVVAMARTYVEGYIKGFEITGKDISIKETVGVEAPVGFELMTREAIRLFNESGLAATVRFGGTSARNLYSSVPNKQCVYDHKNDKAYVWDKGMADRMLEVTRNTLEKHKELAATYGGPAVIETFGETPFEPANNDANAQYDEKQDELNVYYMSQSGQITNQYIKGEERSFTIIAYPIPEIGDKFNEIFNETVAVNTMDYELYKTIQQHIIDVLDQGERVHVTGRGDNHTDITVQLHHLDNPEKQTNFENCVADVNIPVGEVFTSPELEGTNGVLHVTQVYLRELGYRNLELKFKEGMIVDYNCTNFDSEEENKKLIYDNVLFKHDTLPMGEFAIGTNTRAFVMGQKYGIADKLPILIAEKTGPHFAVGDTCYSHAEDVPMYNPNGKECIARDNSCSLLRKEDVSKAYFNCHTDITIPYYELGDITVLTADGRELPIIREGRFVVPGTEGLNKVLDEN